MAATGFFATALGLFNPDRDQTAQVEVTLLPEVGEAVVLPIELPPFSRTSVDVGAELEVPIGVAAIVRSDQPLAPIRQTQWDDGVFGSTLESGAPGSSTAHYFAEEATPIWDLFYLLSNGEETDAQVTLQFIRDTGGPAVLETIVPARSRRTIWVNAVPGMESTHTGAGAIVTSDAPIAAERAMYLTGGGDSFRAGTSSRGAHTLEPTWHFAECATTFFDCFLLLMNPDPDAAAQVEVRYQLPDGQTITTSHVVPASQRRTILVEAEDPSLVDTAIAMSITSDLPLVAERAMWWGPTAASWYEAHTTLGATETGTVWGIGEAWSGGPAIEDAFVLVSNTADAAGQLRVTPVYNDGTSEEQVFSLAASARLTLPLSQEFPESDGRRFSVLVESLGGESAVPLVVEVSRYQSTDERFGNAGGSTTATKIP